jgi:hypothetical protein
LSYIGNTNSSAKIVKNAKLNELTYIVYLAPATLSGYNVCPKATKHCIAACLHESGHNRIDVSNRINKSRITKTKLFFEHREFFVDWVIAEIKAAHKKAQKLKMRFSVRLNGTSDINPILFAKDGKTLFELFPDVQFYDYTKVFNRVKLLQKYKNYDLTFSYSGSNLGECMEALNRNMRVAVVFDKVPTTHFNKQVVDGDKTDLRYLDPTDCIVGLKFKKVRNSIDVKETPFVINVN